MTVDITIKPVREPSWFEPGDIIKFPTTGECMRVTGLRREVARRLGFTRPRRSRRRPWPRVRYTGYIDVIRGDRLA